MRLPAPRGPLSAAVVESLSRPPGPVEPVEVTAADPLADDDLHLALYVAYELHYESFDGVDAAWEWEPSFLALRRDLEKVFEATLVTTVAGTDLVELGSVAPGAVEQTLRDITGSDSEPSLSKAIEKNATIDQFHEFVIHRSAYQLKEADPHSWALPRLRGRSKAAFAEIQSDEYGSGLPDRMHAVLFAQSMRALGLNAQYGYYLDRLPGVTLATVNLMSFFGLHRRWRGALIGHLAAFEMTSPEPNRRYGNALRRLGFGREATQFYDEHVEADSVHEVIAAHDLAGALAHEEPSLAPDIVFGAVALDLLDARFARHLMDSWAAGRSSLLDPASLIVG